VASQILTIIGPTVIMLWLAGMGILLARLALRAPDQLVVTVVGPVG
jgi:hypothetical protein